MNTDRSQPSRLPEGGGRGRRRRRRPHERRRSSPSPTPRQDFTFAYISDAHIQHISGTKFVRNWDRGLIRAVAETNLLDPEARLRHVRGRPRPARHEGGAGPRGGDALEAPLQAPLRDGRARLLPRPRGVLVEALRPPLLQLRPQGRPLRRAEQHPHLRRLDLQPLAHRRAADAGDGRPRQPERLALHGGREAARVAEGRPREGRQDDAGRRLLPLADPEALQGVELLDRGRRGGAGAPQAVREGERRSTGTSTRSSTTRSATSPSTR